MPYLIEKSCGTRTQVVMTADEARFKAQSVRVIEIAEDGMEIGDVGPEGPTVHEQVAGALDAALAAIAADHDEPAIKAPAPAAKKAAKAKK